MGEANESGPEGTEAREPSRAEVLFAPFVLLRVAGLPFQPLLNLSPTATSALIDAALVAQATMEATRVELDSALHSVVPTVDRRTRAAALALKRAVHNRRPPSITPEALAGIRQRLDAHGKTVLDRWNDARKQMNDCLASIETRGAEELQYHVRPRLRALVAREDFRRPLALAAPTLAARVDREWVQRSTPSATKVERSLLSYLMRATAKTSPFSTFMHIAILDSISTSISLPSLDHSKRTSRTVLNRGLVFELRSAGLGCCGDPEHVAFVKSPTVTWVGDGVLSMAPVFGSFAARILRLSRPVRQRLHPALAARVARLPGRFAWTDLMDTLNGIGLSPADAAALGEMFRQNGVITLAPWTDAFSPRADLTGREVLDRCPSAMGRSLSTALSEMGQKAQGLSDADSNRRLALVESIGATAAGVGAALGVNLGASLSAPVVEDGFFSDPAGPIGHAIRGLIDEVAVVLRPRVERRAHYVAVRDLFVDMFGEGGTCHDAVAFLCRAADELGHRSSFDSTHPETSSGPSAPRPRVPTSVLMQLSATSQSALTAGDAVAVVNAVHKGCGWLSARHATGDDESHAALRAGLRSWIRVLTAPAEPIDLLVSGDCNELQAHPKLTERALLCPLEPTLEKRALSWRDLTLQHHRHNDTIEIQSAGSRISPVYLGATFPHRGWGPTYWLTVLANPWWVRPPEAPTPPSEIPEDALLYERETIGRVVVRRALWWMATDRARRIWFRHTGARRSADTILDCARLNIPERFFVTFQSRNSARSKRHRKPFWVDTRNPLLLDVLESLIGNAEYMRISEPLPDIPHWPIVNGSTHVSEFHVELAL